LLHGDEDASRHHNILGTSITPFDVGGISLLEDGNDTIPINDKLPVLSLDCAVELAMDHVVEVNERVLMATTSTLPDMKEALVTRLPIPLNPLIPTFTIAACQIHDGHIEGRNMEGHGCKLPDQLWNDVAHSLGSTSGCRDDVLGSPTAIMPQLPRGAIHSLLGGSDGMDCGHESFHNAKVIVDDPSPFGPSLLHGDEDASRLHNILSTSITPFDVGGISLLEDGNDTIRINDNLPVLSLDCAVELAMDHVVEVNERVVDGNNIHFARHEGSPGTQAPNTSKSAHSNLH
ncbi:hypothetical protein A6R68_16686, partial [Neotoma lepida]